MKKFGISVALVALLVGVAGFSTSSRAEVGQVAVVFTKGGFIVGVGGGEGVLVLRGKRYPFTVSGMSVGFTIGASTTKFVGRALNLKGRLRSKASYAAVGAGGARRRRRRRRSTAERQWRDLAAQRPQGRRGSVGCGGRGHDTLEVTMRRSGRCRRGLRDSRSWLQYRSSTNFIRRRLA